MTNKQTRKYIVKVFSLMMMFFLAFYSLMPVMAVEAEEATVLSSFEKLSAEDSYIFLIDDEIPEKSSITKVMPLTILAYAEADGTVIKIPVTWDCSDDMYDNPDNTTVVFMPSWDKTKYTVLDEESIPEIKVELKARIEEICPSLNDEDLASLCSVTGEENEDIIYNYLHDTLEIGCAGCCGALGNLYVESRFSPTAYNSYENAWGICQWEGGRLTDLQSMYPNSWKTLSSQLEYLKYEFEGGDYQGKSTLSYLKNVEDTTEGAEDAALYFAQKFERCASASYTKRQNWAATIHEGRHNSGYDPTMYLDSIQGGTNSLYIGGWAFDADDTSRQLEIHVYMDGPAETGKLITDNVVANVYRPDVNNVYGCGDYHGFDATVPISYTGTHIFYVYAINVEGGDSVYRTGSVLIKKVVENPEPGDINGDGEINSTDALQALRHSVGEITLKGEEFTRGDVYKDNKVDAMDALQILRYSVKEITSF